VPRTFFSWLILRLYVRELVIMTQFPVGLTSLLSAQGQYILGFKVIPAPAEVNTERPATENNNYGQHEDILPVEALKSWVYLNTTELF